MRVIFTTIKGTRRIDIILSCDCVVYFGIYGKLNCNKLRKTGRENCAQYGLNINLKIFCFLCC